MNRFYPLLYDIIKNKPLFETKNADVPQIRIEDCKKVQAADGTWIDMDELDFEMESAKTAIVGQSPLFGPMIHEFRPIYTWMVDTMATDGIRLFVNPKFANDLKWEEKIFVIIHEIMHCVLNHPDRLEGRDHFKSNIAMDYEVNALIVDTMNDFNEAFINEIHGLYKKEYTNWGYEQIYSDLEDKGWPGIKPPPPPPGPGGNPPPKGSGQSPQINVGDKVKVKATGEKGIVTKINPDGTFEVDQIKEGIETPSIFSFLNESFSREELAPLKPEQKGGSGGSGGSGMPKDPDDDTEYEPSEEGDGEGDGEGEGEGEGDGGQPGQSKGGQPKGIPQGDPKGVSGGGGDFEAQSEKKKGKAKEASGGRNEGSGKGIDREGKEVEGVGGANKGQVVQDGGNTGQVVNKAKGKKIAEESGAEGKDLDTDYTAKKWKDLAKDLAARAKGNKNSGQPGSGANKALLKRINDLYGGYVQWKQLLKRYIGQALSPEDEYAWAKKRHLYKDIYIMKDREKADALDRIIIGVDTSGSMGEDTLKEALKEINGILAAKRAQEVSIVYFDTAVNHVENIKGAKLSSKYKDLVNSGGGTNHNVLFDYIKTKYNNKVSLLIILTDDDARHVNYVRPTYHRKVIWVLYDSSNKSRLKFGKTIFIDVED
jgi:predicted metal-dependent peptidase